MSLAKLQKFIQYLRAQKIMAQDDVLRTVRQMSMFDRRIGQLSAFRGYIKPEQINNVLLEQSRSGARFGECAVRLNFMTPQQVELLVKFQKDDLFLFAQAAISQKISTMDKMVGHIKTFLSDNPDTAKEEAEPITEEKTLLDRKIRAILGNIEKISPLPVTAQKAVTMLEDPEVDLDRVAGVLSTDPGLTASLLRVVNSAFYGLRDKISSISKALIVLGIKKLRQLVIAAAVMQKFQSIPPQFAQRFWEHSMRTAEWSKELGEHLKMEEVDELFVCGLLHNIGQLVTMQYFRPQQVLLDELIAGGRKPLEAEKTLLGGTHADIGGFLFTLWQMPKETIQCAMYHHHDLRLLITMPNLSRNTAIIHMAAAICDIDPNLDAYGYGEEMEKIGTRYDQMLKVNLGMDIENIAARVDANYGNLLSAFTDR